MRNLDSIEVSGSAPTDAALVVPAPGGARLSDAVAGARDWLHRAPERRWLLVRASSRATPRSRATSSWSRHSSGDGSVERSVQLARVIRDEMLPGGGWSQYPGGPPELSVSCLSYFALKVAGDVASAPHMQRARDAILALGGVERAPTRTRSTTSRSSDSSAGAIVPAIPPEMIFLPSRVAVQRLRHVELVAHHLRPAVDPVGAQAGAPAAVACRRRRAVRRRGAERPRPRGRSRAGSRSSCDRPRAEALRTHAGRREAARGSRSSGRRPG